MAYREVRARRSHSLLWEEQKPTTGVRAVYIGCSLCAFGVLLGGLLALAVHPITGVLLGLGGMALLLYAAAGLFGASVRKQ